MQCAPGRRVRRGPNLLGPLRRRFRGRTVPGPGRWAIRRAEPRIFSVRHCPRPASQVSIRTDNRRKYTFSDTVRAGRGGLGSRQRVSPRRSRTVSRTGGTSHGIAQRKSCGGVRKTQAAGSGAAALPAPASGVEHGARVRRLDRALHLVSSQAASAGNGRRGGDGIPDAFGGPGARGDVDAESGPLGAVVPLSGGVAAGVWLVGRRGAGPEAQTVAGGVHARRSHGKHRRAAGRALADGDAVVWGRFAPDGVSRHGNQTPNEAGEGSSSPA
jgi:hypothetical protein